jgi:ATP-dependent HslUV protease ATP-binding subunit HslU
MTQEEEQKLIDMDSVARTAVERVEQAGIIFLDEIDKIAGREGGHGPDVSREGVAARHPADRRRHDGEHQMRHGAHRSHPVHRGGRVSRVEAIGPDPELQGRFPIRVELHPLGRDEFIESSPSLAAPSSSSASP